MPETGLDSKASTLLEYILIKYRWIFVCFFLLPLSFFYDIFFYLRNWIIFRTSSAPLKHNERVRHVQKQVRKWDTDGRSSKMCTARPGWANVSFRMASYKSRMRRIEVNLLDILKVDTDRRVVRVEPLVTMGQLTATLKPLGWSVAVIPELDDLTVGGLVCGEGIETTSHRYGLFQNNVVSCDIVTSSGDVVHCSPNENSDLFYAVPWSHGTLGFLVSCELQIIPVKDFIRLDFKPTTSMQELCEKFAAESSNMDNDFVEALVFDENAAVVMTGVMTNNVEQSQVNSIGSFYKPWFYKHVERALKGELGTEYIPFRDYCHRHSRSIFWEMRDIVPFGNNPIFRFLFGWLIPPKISLLKLTMSDSVRRLYEQNHVIQDLLVPVTTLAESLKGIHEKFRIYPMWLCPLILHNKPGMAHPAGEKSEMYVDIGIYGTPTAPGFHHVKSTRDIEAFTRSVKGFQMLYAECRQSEQEFREMFDHSLYDSVREKYNCVDAFPYVLEKVAAS